MTVQLPTHRAPQKPSPRDHIVRLLQVLIFAAAEWVLCVRVVAIHAKSFSVSLSTTLRGPRIAEVSEKMSNSLSFWKRSQIQKDKSI